MKQYISNESDAHCLQCGWRCKPMPEQDSQFNEFYLSDCCSADIVTDDGQLWECELTEGSPEE